MHARKIAESAEAAWHGAYGTGRLDLPVSIIATLAALPRNDSQGNDVTDSMIECDTADFMAFARHTWTSVIRSRPEITHLVYPIISWIFDGTEASVYQHAHAVAQAALRAGQPDLTGTDRRFDTDLLGNVLTILRPKSALQARGQFYTPASIAELLARMSDVEEHRIVEDPMMGTGGMFRAVAEVMREQGRDPRTVRWVGCDIDPIAVACAAVNSMIWGLGHDIVFHAGNALTPDWEAGALAQRDELRRLATDIERDKRMIALLM
ncbi:N-6 DNA methylase [Actinophytocola sp.]|uniref:N-6 DNA methylase n=1 Tax=Actinophytocola sp. TaxID=1872138 RepID=UPI0025C220F4|nr:N-6 DNA methylase [Actinophytocola sp.]